MFDRTARWALGVGPVSRRVPWGVALLMAALCLASLRRPLTYDEPWYLSTVPLLHASATFTDFLLALPGPAGPLYTLVHAAAEPVTYARVPWVRAVNPLLFVATVALLWQTLKLRQSAADARPVDDAVRSGDATLLAVGACAITYVWPAVGMALTEVPSLVFFAASVCLLMLSLRRRASAIQYVAAAVGGLCLGVAITGRQPLLIALAAPACLVLLDRSLWKQAVLYVAFTLPLPLLLFRVWHGLVPPNTGYVGEGLAPVHAVMAVAYLAVGTLLVVPGFYQTRRPRLLAALAVLAFAANVFVPVAELLPLRGVVVRVLGTAAAAPLARAGGGVIVAAAVLFVGSALEHLWTRRRDAVYVAGGVTLLLMAASNAKIVHQFSSRYVVGLLPLLLIVLQPYYRPNRLTGGLMLLGAAMGAASLVSYLYA